MLLKDVIKYLDVCDNCDIDIYYERTDEVQDTYKGSILNIPWYFLDYELYNTDNSEAIGVYKDDQGRAIFGISLLEREKD